MIGRENSAELCLCSVGLPVQKVLFFICSARGTEMIITQSLLYRAHILLEEVD